MGKPRRGQGFGGIDGEGGANIQESLSDSDIVLLSSEEEQESSGITSGLGLGLCV